MSLLVLNKEERTTVSSWFNFDRILVARRLRFVVSWLTWGILMASSLVARLPGGEMTGNQEN